MTNRPRASWQGSKHTAAMVRAQIAQRFGESAAAEYHPLKNCFTYQEWKRRGYQVRKGEKAIKSITFVPENKETKDKSGRVKELASGRKFRRTVCLFWKEQVDPVTANK